MSIDDKSLGIGIAIGFLLPFIFAFIAIAVAGLIEKIKDAIADRELGLIKENAKLVNEVSQLKNRIQELETKDDERTDN